MKPVMKTETETTEGWETQNKNKPIWTRTPKDVTDDEYNNFFTTTFREFVPPMARSHFNVEGTYEFAGLLYVPGMAPFDAFQTQEQKKSSIRLFVKRVFISDQFDEQLLPKYLGFIKGIVDSGDLPLNVSREILQVRATRRRRPPALPSCSLPLLCSAQSQGCTSPGSVKPSRCETPCHCTVQLTMFGDPVAYHCCSTSLTFPRHRTECTRSPRRHSAGVASRARHPEAAGEAVHRHDQRHRGQRRRRVRKVLDSVWPQHQTRHRG